MKSYFIAAILIVLAMQTVWASEFRIDKQKLRLSLEYENYIGINRSEVVTSGFRASYLMKGHGNIGERVFWDLEVQSGAKTNFFRDFNAGRLSPLIWSNRVAAVARVPVSKFFIGSTIYFRNKWLSEVPDNVQFIDIFGGEGFREITGGISAGYTFSPEWELTASVQRSDLNFTDFPQSNSRWNGFSARLSRKIHHMKLNFDYSSRDVDFNRLVFIDPGPFVISTQDLPLQNDRFWEVGGTFEYSRGFYLSGGYYYQQNDSNNPGFSYEYHRINLLIGTGLGDRFFLQAYGIIQQQDFPGDGFLQFPVLLDENDNNSMAASLVKLLGERNEIEFGIQRLMHNSSFAELDASKYILYVAYSYRF